MTILHSNLSSKILTGFTAFSSWLPPKSIPPLLGKVTYASINLTNHLLCLKTVISVSQFLLGWWNDLVIAKTKTVICDLARHHYFLKLIVIFLSLSIPIYMKTFFSFMYFLSSLMGVLGDSVVRNLPAKAGDVGLIPGLGRSPRGGNGNPLQYSHLENPMDRGTYRLQYVGLQSWTQISGSSHILFHMPWILFPPTCLSLLLFPSRWQFCFHRETIENSSMRTHRTMVLKM